MVAVLTLLLILLVISAMITKVLKVGTCIFLITLLLLMLDSMI